MTDTLRCKICGEEKPAREVIIAPDRFDAEMGDETQQWSGPICNGCREKLKQEKRG